MLVDLIRVPDPTSIDDQLDEPLGLLYIAAVLRNSGYEVRVTSIDANNIKIEKVDVYGLQLYTPTAHIGFKIAKQIRQEYPTALLVAGGAHCAIIPSDQDLTIFDVVIKGEGEYAFLKLISQHENKIPFKSFITAAPIANLDGIPFPARDLVDVMSYHRKVDGNRCFGIIGQRGCGYNCVFCDRALFGDRPRYRSVENIVLEIQQCVDKYGMKYYEFFDDIPFPTEARIKEFGERTKGMGLAYRCNSRSDSKHDKIFRQMKQTGCRLVCFGIESGVQTLLDKMKKGTTVKGNMNTIKMAKESGLMTCGYFILGFPGETKDTIKTTMDFVENSGLDQAQFYTFIPLPGCEAYRELDKLGAKLISTDFSNYYHVTGTDGHGGKTVDTPWLSADELQEEMQKVRKWLRERKTRGGVQDYYKDKLKYAR